MGAVFWLHLRCLYWSTTKLKRCTWGWKHQCLWACGTYLSLWQHIIFIICTMHLPARAELPFLGPQTCAWILVSTCLVFGSLWSKMGWYLLQNLSSLRCLMFSSSLYTVFPSPSISPHIRVTLPLPLPSMLHMLSYSTRKKLSRASMLFPPKTLSVESDRPSWSQRDREPGGRALLFL